MRGILLVMALLLPSVSEACHRCGNYRACKYIKPYVAPVYHHDKTDVFVVQNSYPAPIVGQGALGVVSNGGYQHAVLPFLDPNRYLSQRMELLKAYQATASLETNQADSLVAKITELQAPAVELIARGEAGERLLRSAGLGAAEFKSGHSQAVVVSRDSYGRLQVVPLTPQETDNINRHTDDRRGNASAVGLEADALAVLERNRCVRCHKGPGSAGGDKDFRNLSSLDAATKYKIELFARKGTMPPEGEGEPISQDDAVILEDWVLNLKH